jgi:hypothetical protein
MWCISTGPQRAGSVLRTVLFRAPNYVSNNSLAHTVATAVTSSLVMAHNNAVCRSQRHTTPYCHILITYMLMSLRRLQCCTVCCVTQVSGLPQLCVLNEGL